MEPELSAARVAGVDFVVGDFAFSPVYQALYVVSTVPGVAILLQLCLARVDFESTELQSRPFSGFDLNEIVLLDNDSLLTLDLIPFSTISLIRQTTTELSINKNFSIPGFVTENIVSIVSIQNHNLGNCPRLEDLCWIQLTAVQDAETS